MRTVLSITRYDLIRLFKDRNLAVFTLIMPVVIMSVLSLAITAGDPIIRLDLVDNDQSALAKAFIVQLESVGVDSLVVCVYGRENSDDCDLSKDDEWSDVGKERVEEGDTSGAILIPVGFGEALQRGESVALEYRSNDSLSAPTIVTNMINTARNRVGSSVVVAQLAYDPELATLTGTTSTAENFTTLYTQAEQQWENAPARIDEESSGEETEIGTGANQSVPGVSSMFLLFTLLNAASVLVSERNSGTLQRLFTLPIPKYQV
ncbi:partial Linearmycin resistance permease protein LnrN, partial [Anaerolineae bacterium]